MELLAAAKSAASSQKRKGGAKQKAANLVTLEDKGARAQPAPKGEKAVRGKHSKLRFGNLGRTRSLAGGGGKAAAPSSCEGHQTRPSCDSSLRCAFPHSGEGEALAPYSCPEVLDPA